MKSARSIRSQKWSSKPRVMLLNFTDDEIKRYAELIEKGNAIYECDNKRPGAFMPSATHLVCKFPSTSEKYLSSVLSGKWVLLPSYLEKGLVHEERHLWGAKLDSNYPESIQSAVIKWREKIVFGSEGAFRGWNVGLFIQEQNVQCFTSIIKAGGGEVIFVANNPQDKISQESLKKMTHAYCVDAYENYFYDMDISGINLMKESALYQQVIQVDEFNINEYIFNVKQGQTSPKNLPLYDRKLTHSVPKIILPKELIPQEMEEDSEKLEFSINLPDSIIQVFISNQTSFVESILNEVNVSYSSIGILEATDLIELSIQSFDHSTPVHYTPHDIHFLKGLADTNIELLWDAVNKNKIPDPEILFAIMSVLLNAKTNQIAWNTHNLLCFILLQHPPHTKSIRELCLYQQTIQEYSKPVDGDDMHNHNIMREIASKSLSGMSKYGPLWNFFSAITEGAIKECTDISIGKENKENFCIMLNYLTLIAVEDFEYVKEAIKAGQNPESCFQADLIWIRQGSGYSIEKQEPVLENLVHLFIKSATLYVKQSEAMDLQSKNSEKVFKNISALLFLSLSWASHIDGLQAGYLGYSSMTNMIINKVVEQTNHVSINLFLVLIKEIPISIRPHVLAKKVERFGFGLLTEEENSKIDSTLSLASIVNRFMCFIPHLNVDGCEDLLKATKHVLKNVVYKSVAPDVAKKVNKRNAKGETPLLIACRKGNVETVKTLLQTPGVDASCRDNYGWTPLGEACGAGHAECVKELLKLPIKHGNSLEPKLEIDLCACPELGDTPLHEAIENHNFEITKLLLEKGGKGLLQVFNKEGYTPIDKCTSDEFRGMILQLTETTANFVINQNVDSGGRLQLDPIKPLPNIAIYNAVLAHVKSQHRETWKEKVESMALLILSLIEEYVEYSQMFVERIDDMIDVENEIGAFSDQPVKMEPDICVKEETPSSSIFSKSTAIRRIESDISFVLRWSKCWQKFKSHIHLLTETSIKLNDPLRDCMLKVFEDF